MSRETPATHLARLKVTYQGWRIQRDGKQFTAVERAIGRHITADSPSELEAALAGEKMRRAQS